MSDELGITPIDPLSSETGPTGPECADNKNRKSRGGFGASFLEALHESRKRQADREIQYYRHLINDARINNGLHSITRLGKDQQACHSAGQPSSSVRTRMFLGFGGLPLSTVMVAIFGSGFLIAESTTLLMQGMRGVEIAVLTILAASTVSSIVGFAFSALCGALLFHVMDSPVYAVQVLIICSIAIQLLSVATLWRSIDWSSLQVFLAGGVLGVPVGAYLLLHLPSGAYRGVIGVLLIAYGSYLLLRWPTRSLRVGSSWDACVGFLGGLTGGLAAFPGAFVTIWCGLKGWDKTRQRGVYQPFILAMQPVSLAFIYLMRPPSLRATQLDLKTLAFIPAALLGAWFGLRIFKHLSDRQFEMAVNALLIASGVGLIL